MKNVIKKVAIFATIVLVVVGAIVIVALYPNFFQPQKTYTPEAVQPNTPDRGTAKSAIKIKPGTYETYSEDTFAKNTEARRILFFHATWCPQCRQLDEDIRANSLPDGITILKVDYDTAHELRVKYGVTLQTTVVEVDKSGEKIKSAVVYADPTFANMSQQLAF